MSKRLEMVIDCGNAAFFDQGGDNHDDERRRECAAILKEAARRLEAGKDEIFLRDTNGNTVGGLKFVNARRKNDRNN